MSFASPVWLVGLLPWLGLVIWLLTGHRERAAVPFVSLWRSATPPPRTRKRFRVPPAALILMLTAILLAILGAAGPSVRDPRQALRVTLIVDRDVTMSGDAYPLLDGASVHLLQERLGRAVARIVAVPGGEVAEVPLGRAASYAGQVPPMALRTSELLHAAVSEELNRTDGLVIVFSQQPIELDDDRLVQIRTPAPQANAGIVRIDARRDPAPKVMVIVRNQSPVRHAQLVISTAGHTRRENLTLPESGSEQGYFLEMPALGELVRVELVMPGDVIAADNFAWLVRRQSWPRIEPRIALPAELERMVEVYRRHRAPGAGPSTVAIVSADANPPPSGPAVLLRTSPADAPWDDPTAPTLEHHPVTGGIDWPAALAGAHAGAEPPADWRPLVRSGERVLLAIREQPARQVWVGFASDDLPRSPDYVIFWTNVFDWLGEGHDAYVAEPMTQVSPEWTRSDDLSGGGPLPIEPPPGVYVRADGALRALNAIDIDVAGPHGSDWRQQLPAQARRAEARIRLDPVCFIAALACVLAATALRAASTPRKLAKVAA